MAADKEALTLADLYRGLRAQFETAGVAAPEASARHIAAEASGCAPAEIALAPQTPMTVRMVARADTMAARRVAGEPLQYVLGSWGFRKLDLATDRRALIPRPETEVVAGIAIDWLTETAGRPRAATANVADLGTGCGAIALSIAHEVPRARVYATDSSDEALALAAANLAGLGVAAARVSLHHGDWFDALADVEPGAPPALLGTSPTSLSEGDTASRSALPPRSDRGPVPEDHSDVVDEGAAARASGLRERLEAVVANPPYVADGEVLPAEVRDWEPHEALFGGHDGLDAMRVIVRDARGWLAPGGLLVLELAPQQAQRAMALATDRGYQAVRIERDLAGHERVLVARRPEDEPTADTIRAAAAAMRDGGFVVGPTDTLCGVMARYSDNEAVRRVCDAKERPHSEPMPILVSGLEQADELVELSPAARALAERHWPGGLTLVARRRGGPDPLHGRETLGVRAPAVGWLRWLIDEVGPVTGTSANRHGVDPPPDASTAAASLAVAAAFVIDGSAHGGVASTVADVTGDEPVMLRVGAVPPEALSSPDASTPPGS